MPFPLAAKSIGDYIELPGNMSYINDVMCEDTVPPACVCSIESVTNENIFQCLAVSFDFNWKPPYNI